VEIKTTPHGSTSLKGRILAQRLYQVVYKRRPSVGLDCAGCGFKKKKEEKKNYVGSETTVTPYID